MIKRSEHSVHLEKGMYELCRMRIGTDEEFKAVYDSALLCRYAAKDIKDNKEIFLK